MTLIKHEAKSTLKATIYYEALIDLQGMNTILSRLTSGWYKEQFKKKEYAEFIDNIKEHANAIAETCEKLNESN